MNEKCHFVIHMPTDGADFGRRVHCYGIVYTAVKQGADCTEVAELAVAGVERDIRRDRGVPSFKELVALVSEVTRHPSNAQRPTLLDETEKLRTTYAESSLNRHMIDAAEKVGLSCLNEGISLTQEEASEKILAQFAKGRCCDGLGPYITRHRTHSITESNRIVTTIIDCISSSQSLGDLARRMLNGSRQGLPEKAPKLTPVNYSSDSLNSDVIGGS